MTSEQLFLQYAFPCAEGRVMLKKIDSIDYEKLKLLLRENGNPEQKFLNHCFKDADEQLRAFAEKHGLKKWNLTTVIEFWRHHHIGYSDDCWVKPVIVISLKDNFVEVCLDEKNLTVFNPYNLSLQIGDKVYLHRWTIIEKVED